MKKIGRITILLQVNMSFKFIFTVFEWELNDKNILVLKNYDFTSMGNLQSLNERMHICKF